MDKVLLRYYRYLNHRLPNSNPVNCYNFCVEEFMIVFIFVSTTLYWMVLILSEKMDILCWLLNLHNQDGSHKCYKLGLKENHSTRRLSLCMVK